MDLRDVLDDLPFLNQRGLIESKVHLQSCSVRRFSDGLDGRFHDFAARLFDEDAVSDFVFVHGCGILCHAMPGIRIGNPSVNSRRIQILNALFGVAYRERR